MTKMIDIGDKKIVKRIAVAEGVIELSKRTMNAVRKGTVKKGDVLSASQIAAIQAVKETSKILPLCHNVPILSVDVRLRILMDRIAVRTTVVADYRTGVEMEALVGTTVGLLNIWDMVKYLEKDKNGQYPSTMISGIRVISKKKEER